VTGLHDIDEWIAQDPLGTMLTQLVEQCRRTTTRVAVAESFTAGLVALAIASTPDSGEVFEGGVATYSTGAKRSVLGVADGPVVNEAAAIRMASAALDLFGADVAVATTGVAGPAEQDGEPPGTVIIAVAERGGPPPTAVRHHVVGTPGVVRTAGTALAVAALRDATRGRPDRASAAAPQVGEAEGVPSDNTTLTAVLADYAAHGWPGDFVLTAEGDVECLACGHRIAPDDTIVESLRRLEGASDPADMAAVVALQCPTCSAKGTVVVRHGPEAGEAEMALFTHARNGRGSGSLPFAAAPGEAG
jgi:nicotinamide-nucleotide amidase